MTAPTDPQALGKPIVRYDLDHGRGWHPIPSMEPTGSPHDGEWVRYEDHVARLTAAEARLAGAERCLAAVESILLAGGETRIEREAWSVARAYFTDRDGNVVIPKDSMEQRTGEGAP